MEELHDIGLPSVIKNDNMKTLDSKVIKKLNILSKKYFPNTPIFYNSSCSLYKPTVVT